MCRFAVAAALLSALPAGLAAQPYTPRTPVAFAGAVRSYALHGCGDGLLSAGGPRVQVFCLDGVATTGLAQGGATYQVVLDLTGTPQNGFAGTFFDADYSEVVLPTIYDFVGGASGPDLEGFGIAADPTGRTVFGYNVRYPAALFGPGGVSFAGPGLVHLAYTPVGEPRDGFGHGTGLDFGITVTATPVTATPEPATLALTLGGLAVLGAGASRRRRA